MVRVCKARLRQIAFWTLACGVVTVLTFACNTILAPTSSPLPTNTIAPTPTAPAPSPVPTATPTPIPSPTPTPTPRDISEWTAEDPATFEEIELALEEYRGESLTIASWGGPYAEAQRQSYFLPFQERFGIMIETPPECMVTLPGTCRRPNWHVGDSNTRTSHHLGIEGELEELTPSIHNRYLSGFPEVTRTPWTGGGGIVYSTGLAFNLNAVDELWGGHRPTSWADFWDVERFPGRRGISNNYYNLFFAQLALKPKVLDDPESRLAIAKLTAQQFDESFAKLTEVAPYIDVWLHSLNDCPQLLLSGDLDICTTWRGLTWSITQEESEDTLRYCYECGHLLETGAFSMLRYPFYPEQIQLAELFIAWSGFPHINARISEHLPYGPLNQDALPILKQTLPPERFYTLPNSPQALQTAVFLDEKWLAENLDALEEKLEKFSQEWAR